MLLILCAATCNAKPSKAEVPTDWSAPQTLPIPEAPQAEGICIRISLANQCAWLYQDGKVINSTKVCTGKAGSRTPTGRFHVINKHRYWTSTIYHVAMPYFLRLDPGYFGLHEGHMAGRPASHGCIRLPKTKAAEFFPVVPVGTIVLIEQ